jgi:putative ATP-binding cassette transporter
MPFMRLLSLAVAGIATLGFALTLSGLNTAIPLYVAAGGIALAVAMHLTPWIGAFLRFFVVFYGIGYVGIMALLLAGTGFGLSWLTAIPPLTAFTSAAFGLLAILLARIPVTRGVFALADPYFETADRGTIRLWPLGEFRFSEKWIAFALLGIVILINLAQVGISVRLNQWNREWFDSIQAKNAAEFWRLLFWVWVPIVGVLIFSNLIEFVMVSVFKIRWREWSTHRLVGRWLDGSTHYRMQFNGGVDNPDQRIQEDVNKYVQTTYNLTIAMISQISALVSFSVILWGLSVNLTFPGTETRIPGMLFWIALVYAGLGTIIAHMIGRRLIPLNFRQEQYEANFRFMLARLREFNEPVALLKGEEAEKVRLKDRFRFVLTNFMDIVGVQKWLSAFTQLYGSSNSVIPIVITAPFMFAGQITLGVLTQTAGAFARVDSALSFFIDRYATLADFKAVVDRLTSFDVSVDAAKAQREASRVEAVTAGGSDLTIPALALALPNGKPLADATGLTLRSGERTLLTGPSGSGKSTLFRAIAGIWPFGDGKIGIPAGASVMLLPQRPYIPIGSLRGAISYPSIEGAHDDATLIAALDAARLPQLKDRLGEDANWSQILSGGEQQRLAVARALLAKPDWLFLDEATSALDEPLEAAIYAAIRAMLPATSVVSIGHRSSLINMHDRRIEMHLRDDGLFSVRDVAKAGA